MLTSGNQYLRPEYLTPLPTTLDAKKSPLALLAQTCSQIGADSPNSKFSQSIDKKTKSDTSKDKQNKSDSPSKPSFKPTENFREKSKTPEERSNSSNGSRVRTPVSKNSSSGRCASNQSAVSHRESPAASERKTPNVDHSAEESYVNKNRESASSPASSKSSILTSHTDHSIKDLPLGTFKPGHHSLSSSPYLSGYPPGLPLGLDIMASSLISQHALKAGGLSPYLNYVRMKSPSESLAPICRDPYCTGCNLSSHLMVPTSSAHKTPTSCPAGCTQCDHVTSKASSYLGHNTAAIYAHAQLAALAAASHLPYACNWISGDAAYCGKRFSSSEELLAHLRTHTSVGSVQDANSHLSLLSSGLPPNHPLLLRTYPTPPLSPLATGRYHPYSKSSLLPPSLSSPLTSYQLGHPSIPHYLSPYSIYGPRLGATPGMHP